MAVVPQKEASPPTGEKLYSMEEQVVIAGMKMLMNGEPFHYLDTDRSIPEYERGRRKLIVNTLQKLVTDIRLKKKEGSAFSDYQDRHFEEKDHEWLQKLHPGLNVNGWRVIMILMDPLKYGQGLSPPGDQSRVTRTWKW